MLSKAPLFAKMGIFQKIHLLVLGRYIANFQFKMQGPRH